MILSNLYQKKLIHPPDWLVTNTMYLTVMGSYAYGVANYSEGDLSDFDVYGWTCPPKTMVFPHLAGEIIGFGRQINRFEQWQEHHVFDQDALAGKGRMYDFSVYSVVKYFHLLMENNPNVLDSIFTPQDCVLHCTAIGNMVRENRRMFLHKGMWPKFKGYAYSQLHKMTTKDPEGKRKEIREKYGFDVKFAYHLIRLLNEAEQILTTGDLDLRKNNEQLKAIRRGEVSENEIRTIASDKERQLEVLYNQSTLPWGPDEHKIKTLLLNCLEHHYGSLEKAIVVPDKYHNILLDIKRLVKDI